MFRKPPDEIHCPLILSRGQGQDQPGRLRPVRNVWLGVHEGPSRNPHDPFVIPAARAEIQLALGDRRNIRADDSKVAVFKFKNVRAAIHTRSVSPVGVRRRAKSSNKHILLVPIGTYPVNSFLLYAYVVAKPKPEAIGSRVVRLLQEKRETRGLSMNAVALRAKLSHTMVSRVERELRRPTLDTLLRITEAMEIDLWPLIKEAEQMGRASKGKG